MINYTERLTALMEDIVRRVPPLSFIDPAALEGCCSRSVSGKVVW